MIFITAKFSVRPEYADDWPQIAAELTEGTRSEPGCLWFDWSRSLADPNEYVLVEAFRDDAANAVHEQSDHFKKARQSLPPHLTRTSRIVRVTIPQDDWSLSTNIVVPEPD
jgi:quinol monooxygenase YgiN